MRLRRSTGSGDGDVRQRSTAGAVGLRRTAWVRVTVEDDGAFAEAVGLSHRLPRAMPIALSTAAALAADGVPVVVRRHDGSGYE